MLSSMILSSAICCLLRPMLAWIDRPEIRLLSTFLQSCKSHSFLDRQREMRAKLLFSSLFFSFGRQIPRCLSVALWRRRGVFFCSVRSCHLLAGWLVVGRLPGGHTPESERGRIHRCVAVSAVHLTIDPPAKMMANEVMSIPYFVCQRQWQEDRIQSDFTN